MSFRWRLVLAFCCIAVFTHAQTKLLVIDEYTGKPVPFATVMTVRKTQWFTTDSTGTVVLKTEIEKVEIPLEISRVGYFKLKVNVVFDSRNEVETVLLKPEVSFLPPVNIHAETLDFILSKIRKKIAESQDTAMVVKSFYRQYHIENEKPVFMVEADAAVYFPGQKGRAEEFEMLHVRRMPSEEKNPEKHSDHFVDLLFMNPVAHPEGSMLNKYVGKDVRWKEESLMDSTTSGTLFLLNYERTSEDGKYKETGTLVYDSLYQLLSYHFNRILNPGYGPEYDLYRGKYAWLKLEEDVSCVYRWNDNRIEPGSVHQQYTHLLFHTVFHQPDFELTEDFYWQGKEYSPGVPADKSRFKSATNLYDHGIRPDPDFFTPEYLNQFKMADAGFLQLFSSPDELSRKLNQP